MDDIYYKNIKNYLLENEIYKKVKDYSKNKSDLMTYYSVGKELSNANNNYGEGIIQKYAIKLTNELGKGYNATNLKRFRKFYNIINKGATMWHQLSWSHYKILITLNNINEINYYSNSCVEKMLTVRELQNIIKLKEYDRLPNKTKIKLINKEIVKVTDLVPDPILIKNKSNREIINEKALHKLEIDLTM